MKIPSKIKRAGAKFKLKLSFAQLVEITNNGKRIGETQSLLILNPSCINPLKKAQKSIAGDSYLRDKYNRITKERSGKFWGRTTIEVEAKINMIMPVTLSFWFSIYNYRSGGEGFKEWFYFSSEKDGVIQIPLIFLNYSNRNVRLCIA